MSLIGDSRGVAVPTLDRQMKTVIDQREVDADQNGFISRGEANQALSAYVAANPDQFVPTTESAILGELQSKAEQASGHSARRSLTEKILTPFGVIGAWLGFSRSPQ